MHAPIHAIAADLATAWLTAHQPPPPPPGYHYEVRRIPDRALLAYTETAGAALRLSRAFACEVAIRRIKEAGDG